MKLSRTARHLKRTGVGYRNDNIVGLGYESAPDVIEHEISAMGNTHMVNEIEKALRINLTPDPESGDLLEAIDAIKSTVQKRFGKDAKVMWLTSKTGVRDNYESRHPSSYSIPKAARIISDIGTQGQLFLMREPDFYDMVAPDWLKIRDAMRRLDQ